MKADTVIVLALILSILLVFVYIGKSIGGLGSRTAETVGNWWSEHVSEPIDVYIAEPITETAETWTEGVQVLRGLLRMHTTFEIDDVLLRRMYESDIFIFTAENTQNEYLTQITNISRSTRIYIVNSFPEIKTKNDSSAITDYLRIQGIRSREFNAEEYNRLIIPNNLMKLIEPLNPNNQIHIYSETYDAYLTGIETIGTDTFYQLTITKK